MQLCIISTESLPGGACINSWIRAWLYPGIHNLLSHDPHAFKDSKEDKIRNNALVEEPFRRLEKLYIHMYVDHASAQYPKHVANNL